MADSSADSYLRTQMAIGDRIARQAARIKKQSLQPRPPNSPGYKSSSNGPSLHSKIAEAIDRPGVTTSARPTTAGGTSTYHLSVTPITKGSIATAMVSGASRPGAAVAHQKYVEREGAAEDLASASVRSSIDIGAGQQQYLERTDAVEHGMTLASFGNIANSYEGRLEFWKAVEDHEYSPTSHLLRINPEHDLDFWKAVDTASLEAPGVLTSCDRSKRTEIRIKEAVAVDVIKFAKAHGAHINSKSAALAIEAGPGGRIQTRIIAELPHEIDAEARIEVARRFCEDRIANIEPNRDGRKMTLRYWAVIHAPDDHNDKRNNHLHVVFYERPTDRMIDPQTNEEKWDFTISRQKRDTKRTLRTIHEFEQSRSRLINNRNWVKEYRAHFATLVNAALEEAGVPRRIDPRSFEAMGIDATPIPRIAPKAYQKEKQGVATPAGDKTVTAQWDRERIRLATLFDHVAFDKDIVERFTKRITWMRKFFDPRAPDAGVAFVSWKNAFSKKQEMLAERAAVLYNYEKVRSRLTPPLDSRATSEIAETKALIDDMQKEALDPLNKGYRAAMFEERKALEALREFESNRRSKIDTTPTFLPRPLSSITSQWKKQIFDGISNGIAAIQQSGSFDAYLDSMNEPIDMSAAHPKAIQDLEELDKKIAEEKAAIEAMLRKGVRITDTSGWRVEGLNFINERLKDIEAERATTSPAPQATPQPAPRLTPEPIRFSEAAEATPAAVPARPTPESAKTAPAAPMESPPNDAPKPATPRDFGPRDPNLEPRASNIPATQQLDTNPATDADTSKPTAPSADGPVIDIDDRPKKKTKKHLKEKSADERRRVLISKQKGRSGPER